MSSQTQERQECGRDDCCIQYVPYKEKLLFPINTILFCRFGYIKWAVVERGWRIEKKQTNKKKKKNRKKCLLQPYWYLRIQAQTKHVPSVTHSNSVHPCTVLIGQENKQCFQAQLEKSKRGHLVTRVDGKVGSGWKRAMLIWIGSMWLRLPLKMGRVNWR